MNRCTLLLVFVFYPVLSACSFHSSQLGAMQEVFSAEEPTLGEVAWNVQWSGNEYLLYAVSAPNETIFAYDRRIRVHFNGWNLTEIVGILPNENIILIEQQDDGSLAYYMNARRLAQHQCAFWRDETPELMSAKFVQECSGREDYVNRIDVNSEGIITRLNFVIHPEYPPILLSPAEP